MAIVPINSRGTNRTTPMSAVAELRDGPLDHFCAYLGGLVLPVLANNAPLQTSTTFVTSECFNAFGIAPILGRGITEADAPIIGAGAHVAVISHRLWTTTFRQRPGGPRPVDAGQQRAGHHRRRAARGIHRARDRYRRRHFHAVRRGACPPRAAAASWPATCSAGCGPASPSKPPRRRSKRVGRRCCKPCCRPTWRRPSATQLMDSKPRLLSLGTGISRLRERYSQPLMLILGLTALLLILACINLGGLLLARLNARSVGAGRAARARRKPLAHRAADAGRERDAVAGRSAAGDAGGVPHGRDARVVHAADQRAVHDLVRAGRARVCAHHRRSRSRSAS